MQAVRTRTSEEFRNATKGIMFSSDVTARGMDYPDVTLVLQVTLPHLVWSDLIWSYRIQLKWCVLMLCNLVWYYVSLYFSPSLSVSLLLCLSFSVSVSGSVSVSLSLCLPFRWALLQKISTFTDLGVQPELVKRVVAFSYALRLN